MDEQGISNELFDRLNPALYDLRVYDTECPYANAAGLETRPISLASPSSSSSSDGTHTTSASSPCGCSDLEDYAK
ncbi:hypothetical protein LIER_31568 [Lithospermum erythrorhizon]|uniref:Uncharacterized protein n=1 Tax=Lithospermum erythrorhizon TaxID=34254 RepID=A0AAV3RUX8_LITER